MSAASDSLRKVARVLAKLRDGEAVAPATARISKLLNDAAEEVLQEHRHTGHSADTLTVTAAGPTVLVTSQRYLVFHAWWPFRQGVPEKLKKQVREIFREESARVLASR